MDPNATLDMLRAALGKYYEHQEEKDTEARLAAADEIAALFEGLDWWISRGGFLPALWARGARAPHGGRKEKT